ncbi:MAG: hypothetical protein COY57_04785 [Flavobacteriales bacterium CG_4_10_14_0_8_um_filter_32_5]|nr:MAG: hypothetical protein COY57_04785 [Flavobacteriales bacterium CG_4_10_14_0_8_um_filter_32_5]
MISRRYLRIKTFQALYAYFHSGKENQKKVENELFLSFQKMHDLYLLFLLIGSELSHLSMLKIEESKSKRLPTDADLNPSTKFITNRIFKLLETNSTLSNFVKEKKISWNIDQELMTKLFNFTRKHDIYLNYMQNEDNSFENDKKFVVALYKKIIAEYDFLISGISEKSIYWTYDEIDFVLSMVIKSIKKLKENDSNLDAIFHNFTDKEDDTEFVKILFNKTIVDDKENSKLIAEKTQNWEVERIATVDILIMKMAISELTSFSQIPIKVTLNEYIDLSKTYSTPKSKLFVNGILDKLIVDLKSNGKIVKTGRGLVE